MWGYRYARELLDYSVKLLAGLCASSARVLQDFLMGGIGCKDVGLREPWG